MSTLPVLAALLLGCGTSLFAGDSEADRQTLKGITGVKVVIGQISQDALHDGLSASQIQTDVELRLRKAGVKVISLLGSDDSVLLWVDANLMKVSGEPQILQNLYIFNCEVSLIQGVSVAKNNTFALDATWSTEVLGNIGRNSMSKGIRDIIGDLVDKFLNAYLSVNPK